VAESCVLESLGKRRHDCVNVLSVHVSVINIDDAVGTVERWIEKQELNYVCVTGAHGAMESRRNERLRAVHNNARMVTPDGMPIVWFARLLGKSCTRRVYDPDLMRVLTIVSEQRGYRQFNYGGAEGVAEAPKGTLVQQQPKLQVVGTLWPPFRNPTEDEDCAVVEHNNAAEPDIVWVGLSTSKQESWMVAHRNRITAPVMIGVGAAFDFLAETKRQAPVWAQSNGLEWAFRPCSEPRHLWPRYAYIVPMSTILTLGALVRQIIWPSRQAPSIAPSTK
jgi:N-acetylglucosaminyldiphosphoundecaprenol N-acetyl-beta-D-mannosaminyltransferase